MSSNKMSRKDFLSMSAVLGVSSLVGSSSLMTSCSGGGAVKIKFIMDLDAETYEVHLNGTKAGGGTITGGYRRLTFQIENKIATQADFAADGFTAEELAQMPYITIDNLKLYLA